MLKSEEHQQASSVITGFFLMDSMTWEVTYLDGGMQCLCPGMKLGIECFRGFGESAPCPGCPAKRLKEEPYAVGFRYDPNFERDLDIVAFRVQGEGGKPRALVCYGRVGIAEKRQWLEDKRCQSILRQTRTIVFEYDLHTGEQFISSFISDYLAGNYDGRRLSEVLVGDGVIHPDDVRDFEVFHARLVELGGSREIILRMKSRDGAFLWHKLSVRSSEDHIHGHKLLVGTISNVDEETRLRESLRHRAEYDTTSGVFNKETFYTEVKSLLNRQPGAHNIVRFDIDRFKTVNELFGAAEGDLVLNYLGEILSSLAKEGEIYARLGNDVFCLCVARSDEETIQMIEEINAKVNKYPIDFDFIMSSGIFRVPRYDGQPINILCDRAALAQRSVKGNYVCRYAFYEDRMGEALSKEHYIIGSMHRALDEGQFIIYLQPKYDIKSKTIFGVEALARWSHPKDGIISPGDFIPLFERNGFILKLDEYIWELACKTLRSWIDRGIEPVPISVNVSRIHLHDPAICDKILALTQKYRLEPRLLELEITESAYTENPQSLNIIMDRLQSLGYTFSMDDFGSGYSSLNMLKDIPVDILKIDLNFLKESRRGQSAGRTILEATIYMARRLELPVIVEGVETAEQADILLQAGCTMAQGYYFDRPMPVESFERLLSQRKIGLEA